MKPMLAWAVVNWNNTQILCEEGGRKCIYKSAEFAQAKADELGRKATIKEIKLSEYKPKK